MGHKGCDSHQVINGQVAHSVLWWAKMGGHAKLMLLKNELFLGLGVELGWSSACRECTKHYIEPAPEGWRQEELKVKN